MSTERSRKIRQTADEQTAEMIRRLEENGELQHLYGKPLRLDDDPAWLGARMVRDAGFSHPLLERARDLEEPRAEAEKVLERLRRRHTWLSRPDARLRPEQVHAFNEQRRALLSEYEDKLRALNRAIRDFNLAVPLALHRRAVPVDETVQRVADEFPPLVWQPPERRRRDWRFWRR